MVLASLYVAFLFLLHPWVFNDVAFAYDSPVTWSDRFFLSKKNELLSLPFPAFYLLSIHILTF